MNTKEEYDNDEINCDDCNCIIKEDDYKCYQVGCVTYNVCVECYNKWKALNNS